MSESSRRPWLWLLAAAVSALLLWLLLRQVDLGRLGELLLRADGLRLGLAVASALMVNVAFSALGLRAALAAHEVPLPASAAFRATLGHLALHAGGSLVVGKTARALYLSRVHGVDAKRALGAEVTLLGLKVGALVALASAGALIEGALWAALGGAALVASALVWARRGRLSALAAAFGWALGMGLGQLAVFWLVLSAVGASVPVSRLVGLFPLCLLGAKVPFAVMGLGVRESLVVLLFRGSAPAEALLGASLLFSLIEQVLPGLLGLAFAPRFVVRALGGRGHP